MRVEQPIGERGSLKWLQLAVQFRPDLIQPKKIGKIEWRSPLAEDNFAEYRDGAFLKCLGLGKYDTALKRFWPQRGPQWDALGLIDDTPILVEAKAHLKEFMSPRCGASKAAKTKIDDAMKKVQAALGSKTTTDWTTCFYQYCNRLAHLNWLHENGIGGELIFVSFIGDMEMGGPKTSDVWHAAFEVTDYALGIPKRNKLRNHIHHLTPDVSELSDRNYLLR